MSKAKISSIQDQINALKKEQQKLIEGILDKVVPLGLTFKRTEEYDDNNYFTSFRLHSIGDWMCEYSEEYIGTEDLIKLEKYIKKILSTDAENHHRKLDGCDNDYAKDIFLQADAYIKEEEDTLLDVAKLITKAIGKGISTEAIADVLEIADGYANENNIDPDKYDIES